LSYNYQKEREWKSKGSWNRPTMPSIADPNAALAPSNGAVFGADYFYRKEWIRQRIEKLANVFGLDVLIYAILSSHPHLVVRSRPDVVNAWSDRQAALGWLQIFPARARLTGPDARRSDLGDLQIPAGAEKSSRMFCLIGQTWPRLLISNHGGRPK